MQSASWSDGKFQYLLIGGDDPYLIERSATIFRDRSVEAEGQLPFSERTRRSAVDGFGDIVEQRLVAGDDIHRRHHAR